VLSPSVDNLVAQLTRLPGIGSRTAQRLAFHVLSTPKDEALALATAIEEVKERVRFCRECGNLTEEELCGICLDTRRDRIIAFAAQNRLPAIYHFREFAAAGGLISYGPRITDGYRQAGNYVGQILKGAKPGNLPVLQPTKFEMVINLKTASALNLALPNSIQLLADEVIE